MCSGMLAHSSPIRWKSLTQTHPNLSKINVCRPHRQSPTHTSTSPTSINPMPSFSLRRIGSRNSRRDTR